MTGGACVAGETATAAGGTHPTGMHSGWKSRLQSTNSSFEICTCVAVYLPFSSRLLPVSN